MPYEGIRRLSLADLDDARLRRLVDHGEDLFVERKRQPPSDGLGRVVASFANSLGGWLLLGVEDDGSLVGHRPPGRADAQSHVGQLLAAEVDPLPPFVAAERELDGVPLLVIRVFESADTPHILRTGSIPIRTPSGTQSVNDQALLLELARRGEDAMGKARSRISLDSVVLELAAPERPELVAVSDAEPYAIVRASLLTRMPHFATWSTSQAAAEAAAGAAGEIAQALGVAVGAGDWTVKPRGRGVTVGWSGGFQVPVRARVAIDAQGVVGAHLGRGIGTGEATFRSFEPQYIAPLVRGVSALLRRAEAHGRAAWRLDIGLPRQDFRVVDAERRPSRPFFSFAELASPPSPGDADELSNTWSEEFARELGVEAWSRS